MAELMIAIRVFVFLVVAVIVAAGVLWVPHRWWLRRTAAQWQHQWRTVQFGPANATCRVLRPHGSSPDSTHYGAVGIVDNQFIFQGLFGRAVNVIVPLEHVHGVGLRLFSKGTPPEKRVYQVQVDFETPGGWQVYTLSLREWRAFAAALSELTGLPIITHSDTRLVPPTATATRMQQYIYGKWQADFTDQFYVAADRILFGWRNAILFDTITAITLYDRASLLDGVLGPINPFSQDMIRIDYTNSDGTAQVIGFQMAGARKWADRIADRSGAPLTVHAGRKKH